MCAFLQSSRLEIKEPSEILRTERDSHAAMLTIMVFEPCKVSLETICGGRDSRIVEVMEHMRQGFEQHTSGAFEIAENPATLRNLCQLVAKSVFPSLDSAEKSVSLDCCTDRCNLEEYPSQMPGIWTRGVSPTPHQPLALNVH